MQELFIKNTGNYNRIQNLPKISVIVPIYRVEDYLTKCIQSILTQTYPNLEVVLVDDGSPDGCPAICDEYAAKDSRIIVVHKKNGGLASARNAGLDISKGSYIAFVDSDDWIEQDTYSRMMEMSLEFDLDIVCCAGRRIQGEYEIERCFSYYSTGSIISGKEITREILLDRIGSQVVKGLYKRRCWKEVRFPIGQLYEDIPVTFHAFAAAGKVGFIDEPFYNYRENESGISLSPKPIKPYHEYLGFRAHFDYANANFPEIVEDCCAKTAMYAVSTCFHYYSERSNILKPHVDEVEAFLTDNKRMIMDYNGHMNSRRIALNMFYLSKPLFKVACRAFNRIGLQKALHFNVK